MPYFGIYNRTFTYVTYLLHFNSIKVIGTRFVIRIVFKKYIWILNSAILFICSRHIWSPLSHIIVFRITNHIVTNVGHVLYANCRNL